MFSRYQGVVEGEGSTGAPPPPSLQGVRDGGQLLLLPPLPPLPPLGALLATLPLPPVVAVLVLVLVLVMKAGKVDGGEMV